MRGLKKKRKKNPRWQGTWDPNGNQATNYSKQRQLPNNNEQVSLTNTSGQHQAITTNTNVQERATTNNNNNDKNTVKAPTTTTTATTI